MEERIVIVEEKAERSASTQPERSTLCSAPQFLRTGAGGTRNGKENKRQPIGKRVRFAVLDRDGFACRYCGRGKAAGAVLHVDHVKPVALGGGNEIENLVTACSDCNLGKSAKPLSPVGEATTAPSIWALAFDTTGRVHRQYEITASANGLNAATVFSWFSGEANGTEALTDDYLARHCMTFASREAFLSAADFWADFRLDRINPDFVR